MGKMVLNGRVVNSVAGTRSLGVDHNIAGSARDPSRGSTAKPSHNRSTPHAKSRESPTKHSAPSEPRQHSMESRGLACDDILTVQSAIAIRSDPVRMRRAEAQVEQQLIALAKIK